MMLGFIVAVLQGFGPTLDMQTARDRCLGIMFGDIVVYMIFTRIWPVSVANIVRRNLADAFDRLADLLALQRGSSSDEEEAKLRHLFAQSITKTRSVLPTESHEGKRIRRRGPSPIDNAVVTRVQALVIPVCVVCGDQPDDAFSEAGKQAMQAHHQAISAWLHRCAVWVRSGVLHGDLLRDPPRAPRLAAPGGTPKHAGGNLQALETWETVLHDEMAAILEKLGTREPGKPHDQESALARA